MRRWVDFAASAAENGRHSSRVAANATWREHERYIWDSGWHWGEWLEPDVQFNPLADPGIVATAYLAHSARIVSETAEVLGDIEAVKHYAELADLVEAAWRTEFLVEGSLAVPSQANLARALAFGLIPDDQIKDTADALVRLIEENGTHLATGFLSTGMLLPVLADHGHADVAYNLLFQKDEPGWLVMLERGATTVWEAWDGIDSAGRPRDSLNHYSKGAVIAFLHEYVAGIRPAAPGYSKVEVRPYFDARLQWAEGSLDTRYGEVRSRWEVEGEEVVVGVVVPPQTTARVELFDGVVHEVGAGDHVWRVGLPVAPSRTPYPDRRGEAAELKADAAHVEWNGRIDPLVTTFGEVLDADDSRALLEHFVPGVGDSPMSAMVRPAPLEMVLTMIAGSLDRKKAHELRSGLAGL
jgi:alpha-L-rhamnosidase